MPRERSWDLVVMTVGGVQVLPEESLLDDWPPSHHLNKKKHTDHGTFVGYSGTNREGHHM